MELAGRDAAHRSRRWFLFALSASALADGASGRGRIVPSAAFRYPDASTEFPVIRLTDPAFASHPAEGRAISRRSNFLLYSSNMSGRFEAYQMDLKKGESKQLTDSDELEPGSL